MDGGTKCLEFVRVFAALDNWELRIQLFFVPVFVFKPFKLIVLR